VRAELIEQTATLARRLAGAERRLLDQSRRQLVALQRVLPAGAQLLIHPFQRSDRAGERLRAALRRALDGRRLRLSHLSHVLARHSPQAELARASERLKGLHARLRQGLAARMTLARREADGARRRVDHAEQRLRSAYFRIIADGQARLDRLDELRRTLGHESVLARGFALVRDEQRTLLRHARDIAPGMRIEIEFSDGSVRARAEGDAAADPSGAAPRPKRAKDKDGGGGQGTLF
jgi:exodeoxyribonuclease VII large subunit